MPKEKNEDFKKIETSFVSASKETKNLLQKSMKAIQGAFNQSQKISEHESATTQITQTKDYEQILSKQAKDKKLSLNLDAAEAHLDQMISTKFEARNASKKIGPSR